MPRPEDTLRSPKYYAKSEREQILQQGGDELVSGPEERKADDPRRNREKLGVNEEHKTEEMQRQRRGTFP